MTSVNSEDETEILKRQIRYLTDLINNSAGTSKKDTKHRPATYSHQRGKCKKYFSKGEQQGQSHNKAAEKSDFKTKSPAKFSWKKSSSHDKSIAPRSQLEPEIFITTDKAFHRTASSKNLVPIISSSNTSQDSSSESTKEVSSSRYLSRKPVNLTTSNVNMVNSIRKLSTEKSSAKSHLKTGNENFQVAEEKNLNENYFDKINNISSSMTTGISKKLRNHSFMNKSKSTASDGTNSSSYGSKTISVPCHSTSNQLDNNVDISDCSESSKDRIPSSSTDRIKDVDTSLKNINNCTTAKILLENSNSGSVKKQVSKNQDKNSQTTGTSNNECSPSKLEVGLLLKNQDKNSKTTVTSKKESSLTKKEVMEQLNRKLLETSNTINQLKKQISSKSGNGKRDPVNVRTERPVKFDGTAVSFSNVESQLQSTSLANTKTYSSPHYQQNKVRTTIKETDSKTMEKDLTIKTRYSLKKISANTGPAGNSRQIESTNFESKIFNKHNGKEVSFPGPSRTSSFSDTHQIPFKSKYCLRKNASPQTSSSNSTKTSSAPKSSRCQKTNVVKSKYHFRKTNELKLQSSHHLEVPHSNKGSHGQFQLPVFNSKYKFRKTTPKNSTSSVSPKIRNTPAIVKIIKSKYKLRKISQNSCQISKQRKTPMKTILKSKYKLRKVPADKASNSSSSSYVTTRNQLYNLYENRNYPYHKNIAHWNYNKNKFRKYYGKDTSQMYKRRKWTLQNREYGFSWHQYMGGYKAYPTRSPLVINKKYMMKRIQNPTGKHTGHANKSKLNKTDHQLVVINGMLYKSSGRSLVKTNQQKSHTNDKVIVKKMNSSSMKIVKVRGVKFQMDSSGKTLKRLDSSPVKTESLSTKPVSKKAVHRVDFGGMTFVQTKPGTLEQLGSNQTKVMASRMKHRSIITAAAKYKKDNTKKKIAKKFCMYFNRFGKCQRGDKCPFVHDPERVAVCTRFLRGTCRVDDCPFSHKTSKEKMPTCSYFLRGVCNRDDCPYLHVNVSKTAKVCPDFIKGFCPLGEKCTKKHTLICPSFSKTGTCSEVKPCKLKHVKKKQRYISPQITESSPKDKMKLKRKPEEPLEDSHIPFKQRKLPTYISITADDEKKYTETTDGSTVSAIKIRPQLGLK